MANIDDYLVASYRCNGKGNSDADKDMLKDLSGNGYDIKLHGFSFDKWSGYGEDTIAFDSNNVCHKDMVEFTSTKISCQGDVEFDDKWILKLNGMPPSYRIKVSGVSNIGNGAIIVNVGRKKEASGVMSYLISNDGIYTPGDSDKDVDDQGIYIEGGNYNIKGPFSIELLPSFKDALVFDGIDDYGICENFPAINDFTFVYKRINLNPSKSTNCFLSKSVSTNQAQQFCSELAYSKNVYVRLGSKDIAVKDIYNPELSIVYVTRESYNGEMDLVSSNYTSTVDNLYIGTFSRGVQAYVWNGALYALDIYDRTLSDEYLQKALNRMNDIDINWKDGVGEVTDQHLTVSPGSGTGNAAVSFGSVMNKGLDRTLELEITTPKGVKKTLTVNQEGCRQAYITSDGKRWLTSDNRVYGVLKGDAPCECFDITPGVVRLRIDDADPNPLIQSCGDSSWIKGRRCLVKKTDAGVVVCYLDGNNSELFHDGTPAKLDGTMGQWMTDIPSYRYSHKGGEYDVSDIQNIQDIVHNITLTHDDADDSITEWGNKGLFRRCLVGVTKAVNIDNKLWSKKGGESTGYLTHSGSHNYATALGGGFDIIDYETHCKIAHLFYAKYANRNPQGMNQFGTGSYGVGRTIGTTSSLGNNDGKTSTQISFLGIEDFYGCMYEWMSGIHSKGSVSYIYDGFEPGKVPTADYRTVDVFYPGFTSKVLWGEYGDMLPVRADASVTTHYCDKCSNLTTEWGVMLRSGINNYEIGGVVSLSKDNMFNYSIKDEYAKSSRIQYRGLIQIIENPAEFIAMPIGF